MTANRIIVRKARAKYGSIFSSALSKLATAQSISATFCSVGTAKAPVWHIFSPIAQRGPLFRDRTNAVLGSPSRDLE